MSASSITNLLPTKSSSPRIGLQWSPARLAALKALAESARAETGPRAEAILAAAQLRAAAGDFEAAETAILAVLDQHPESGRAANGVFLPLLEALFVIQRLDLAARLLCDRFDPACAIELAISEQGPGVGRLIWDVLLPERMRFTFDRSIIDGDITNAQVTWFVWILPLFATYARNWPGECGSVVFNQWDCGLSPGLAMCDSRPGYFLVPCNAFTRTHAYQFERDYFMHNDVPWASRKPIAFWRGSTTGHPSDPSLGWRSLPRIRLCEIAQLHGDLIDAGISGVAQIADPAAEPAIQASGLMRSFVPVTEFNKFKYQIDIDGNTNAWPALFQKLLTGSPVLKVASPYGFRQWYYDRLKPWINYVPVDSDMSDLVEKILWLKDHDAAARAIGEQGQALALSLDYEGELKRNVRTVAAALRYFAGQPETELYFAPDRVDNACLCEGWFNPARDGVPTRGIESRIVLPRPVAPEDFVISLDLSCYAVEMLPPAQRVTIVANGEVLSHVILTTRQTVDCALRRTTIDAAEDLTITLLHPDAMQAASPREPLDARAVSIVLHGIKLTPVSCHAATGRTVPAIPLSPRGQSPDRENLLYGPDLWLPEGMELLPIFTHHGSVVFADVASGRLLHGRLEASPPNVVVAKLGGTGYLLHISPDRRRYCIRVPTEQQHEGPRPGPGASAASWTQAFQIVQVPGSGEDLFGLSHGGWFLCAEPDGRVTLSRRRIGLWELFRAPAGRGDTNQLQNARIVMKASEPKIG